MMTQRPSILLAEDENELAASIARSLAAIGMRVEISADGLSADVALTRGVFDAAILDVGLPHLDGFAVLARLRARDKMLPVLMLTARGEVADRVRGLNLGADDYLSKPFALDELEARIRALLRRGRGERARCGPLTFDIEARRFQLDGRALNLTPREHSLLAALIARPGRLLSKEQLASHVFGLDGDANLDAIEIYVHRLRRKLEGANVAIVTMRGLGYLLEAPDDDPAG
jgi:two-component system, OmpR family, response regulator TctD